MQDISNLNPKKILVCQLRQIGDVLLSTPSLQLIKERFPNAALHLVTEKKCVPVLKNNPHVDHIWSLDKATLRNPFAALSWYRKVGRSNYDLIIDFQRLPRCRYIVMFSNAKVKLTQHTSWYNRFIYTHFSDVIYGYAAQLKASILRPLDIHWTGQLPKLYLDSEEKAWAANFLQRQGLTENQFVTIAPAHRRITRKWPERHFAGLIQLMRAQHPDLRFLLLYGPGEKNVAETVAQLAGKNVVIPEKILSLREMAAVQARAALHIGNCSAPRHFAVAVETPSLAIHGATGFGWCPQSTYHSSIDKGLPCRSCNKNSCKTIECLEDFHPEECLNEALRLLAFKKA